MSDFRRMAVRMLRLEVRSLTEDDVVINVRRGYVQKWHISGGDN